MKLIGCFDLARPWHIYVLQIFDPDVKLKHFIPNVNIIYVRLLL